MRRKLDVFGSRELRPDCCRVSCGEKGTASLADPGTPNMNPSYSAGILLAEDPEGEPAADWRGCRLKPGKLFVVGDPKQSIYRFRGSDLAVYREARKIADDNQMLSSLTASFRTSEPLVHALNVMFSKYNYNNDLPYSFEFK